MRSIAAIQSVCRCTPHLPLVAAIALFAAGCASAPPSKVIVPIPAVAQTISPGVRIVDLRSPQQRQARTDTASADVIYLGDDVFEPAPLALLNRALSAKLGNADHPFVIDLVRFDVGVSNSAVRDIYRSSPPLVIVSPAPAGAVVTGNLIGRLLLAAFQGGASNQSVVVRIEVRIPSGPIEITDFGALYSGRSITDAIQTILPRALDSLAGQMAEEGNLRSKASNP